jgi:hypothetical protein
LFSKIFPLLDLEGFCPERDQRERRSELWTDYQLKDAACTKGQDGMKWRPALSATRRVWGVCLSGKGGKAPLKRTIKNAAYAATFLVLNRSLLPYYRIINNYRIYYRGN